MKYYSKNFREKLINTTWRNELMLG